MPGGADGKIYLIDFDEAKPTPVTWAAHASYVSGLAVAGKYLISGGSDHQLIWWDAATREKLRRIQNKPDGSKRSTNGVELSSIWRSGMSVGLIMGRCEAKTGIVPFGRLPNGPQSPGTVGHEAAARGPCPVAASR